MALTESLCVRAAFALVLAGLLVVLPAAAETGRIAFVSDRSGAPEIWVMNADGTGQSQLTFNNLDGVTLGDDYPAWSPDGSRVASYTKGPFGYLNVMSADGSDGAVHMETASWLESAPRWSPDGSRLAYYSWYKWYGNQGVDVVRADGSGEPVRLTATGGPLSWSPDGSRIAYAQLEGAYRDPDGAPGSLVGGSWEVFTANADGTGARVNLSDNPANDTYPAFSPNGSRIAFASDRDGDWAVYVMKADGTDPVRLAPGGGPIEWSPDGSMLAYRSGPNESAGVSVVRADGSGEPTFACPAETVSWSPDSRRIAYAWTRDGNEDIYVANADGTSETRLTDDPGRDYGPAWWGVVDVRMPPTAAFSISPSGPAAPNATVTFTDGSSDPDGTVAAWLWDFGDGSTLADRNPTHAYTAHGAYTVTLTVTDNDGLTATATRTVTVLAPQPLQVPMGAAAPGDADADGRYEDVNGNGRMDFADVVLYFNQMEWIAANEPLAAFDYNGNGRIDFADAVWLFNNL